MSAVEDRLAEIEARADVATEGPWHEAAGNVHGSSGGRVATLGDTYLVAVPNAAFIAAARTDVPALAAALRAVLALHKPKAPASVWDMVSWTSCSCGATEVTSRIDGSPSVAPAEYPCPTVRAIATALGVTP